MSAEALRSERIEGTPRPWRNPFVIAFVIGALFLTVLPFIQRLALHAPKPLVTLGGLWSLPEVDRPDARLTAHDLKGKVWLASFVPAKCDADCQAGLALFASTGPHLADLGDQVAMVTFVEPGGEDAAKKAHAKAPAMWRLATGDAQQLGPVWRAFAAGWDAQLQALTSRSIAFMARPTLAVVDQDGAVRGLWPADDEGRGHAINAVRMFARYGTEP